MEHNRQDLDRQEDSKMQEASRLGWYLLIALGFMLLLIDISNWDSRRFYTSNYHSQIIGFITAFVLLLRDQIIVDKRLFRRFFMITASIFLVLIIKQIFTTTSFSAIVAAAFPLLYLSVLRLLIFIYFPDYPTGESNPVLLQFGKGEVYWKDKENGYIPTRNEKIISYVAYVSFFILFGLTILQLS